MKSRIYSIVWFGYARDEPHKMNTVSPIEKAEIEKDLRAQETGYIEKFRVSDIPAKDIIKNGCFIALILTGICTSVVDFVVINMVPKYLQFVQDMDLDKNGLLR